MAPSVGRNPRWLVKDILGHFYQNRNSRTLNQRNNIMKIYELNISVVVKAPFDWLLREERRLIIPDTLSK